MTASQLAQDFYLSPFLRTMNLRKKQLPPTPPHPPPLNPPLSFLFYPLSFLSSLDNFGEGQRRKRLKINVMDSAQCFENNDGSYCCSAGELDWKRLGNPGHITRGRGVKSTSKWRERGGVGGPGGESRSYKTRGETAVGNGITSLIRVTYY